MASAFATSSIRAQTAVSALMALQKALMASVSSKVCVLSRVARKIVKGMALVSRKVLLPSVFVIKGSRIMALCSVVVARTPFTLTQMNATRVPNGTNNRVRISALTSQTTPQRA